MPDQKRLLVLAIDAANSSLLRSWAADGTLPNVAALMAAGLTGETRSMEGLYIGATWPSFSTGLNPARHGIWWLLRLRPGSYQRVPCVPEDLARRKTLWETLSEAGRRVAVLDVPLTRQSPRLNGVQTVEWGVHDAAFGFRTSPRRLGRDILTGVGAHPAPAVCDKPQRSPAEYREFADQLVRGATARALLTRQILAAEPWDFAIQVFSEAHCAGHQLWHFHDPTHPAFDPEAVRQSGDLVRVVYQAVDTAIGNILDEVPPDTTVVLLVLHGMSYIGGASLLLPKILTRLGVTTPLRGPRQRGQTAPPRPVTLIASAWQRVPKQIRSRVFQLRQLIRQRVSGRGLKIPIDPARSQCFFLDAGYTVSGIRLNLVGREPQGLLAPGAEADRFCDQLIHDLLDIVNPGTQRPLVKRVLRTAELYRGEYLDELPDLLVEWDVAEPLGTTAAGTGAGAVLKGFSNRVGLVEATNTYCRTGEHRVEGMFVARGPGIRPSRLDRVISNLDLAPTFARLLGCDMPNVDGQPVPELLN